MKHRIIEWLNDENGFEKLVENILFIGLCIAVFIKISAGSWDALIFVVLAFVISPFVKIPKPIKRLIMCLGIVYILFMGIG
ncbi:MAG: hypothetical protein AAF378_00205 [Cyanobacteria bacterium P01_A01_bin.84]